MYCSLCTLRVSVFRVWELLSLDLCLRLNWCWGQDILRVVVLFSWGYIYPLHPGDDVWLLLLDECYCHLILVLIIWWCPCVESSFGLLEKVWLWPVCSLDKTVSFYSASFFSKAKLVTPNISWLPTFASQSSLMKNTTFLVLVLERLVGIHRTSNV